MDHKATIALRDLEHILVEETAEPKALPLSLLEDITGHFSNDLEIGRGGFAVVYMGKLGDRKVAVKKLLKAYMHEKEFDQEIQCLIRAKHKNVVRFLGYCDDRQRNMERCDEKLLMADVHQRLMCFEYMPKGSLDKYINTHREWETCYKIIKGICEGLQCLHDNHIIHLDLKPANILLDNDMVPKITDFGLSRCLDENQSQVHTRTVVGTMAYMAPERLQGSGIQRSSDLYSLGIIIREILTGQKAHQSFADVLKRWRSQQDTVYKQISVCYEIASDCTRSNPKDRPASAQDIIDRLHEMERILGLYEKIFCPPTPAQLLPSSASGLVEMKPPLPAKLGPSDVVMAATKMASPYEMVEVMPYLCVSVVKARDLPTMLDPYVEVKLGNFKGVTRRLEKNANPVWQQLFTVSAAHLQSNQLQVIVKHKDMLRDDFVGRVVFDTSHIPNHSPPNSRLAPQWYHLSDAQGESFPQGHSLGEIMLAVCLATQVDEAFPDAPPLSLHELTDTRSKVYYSPKLIYLKVAVIAAHDLVGTKEDRPLANAIAKIQLGSQIRRTRPGQPQGSVNPTWNEEFLFVASEPFEHPLVVTVEENVAAGRDEPIGRIIIPVASPYVLRNDLAKSVPSKWLSLSRGMTGSKNKESFKTLASKIQLRMSLETTYHVMYESWNYMSDLQPAAGF